MKVQWRLLLMLGLLSVTQAFADVYVVVNPSNNIASLSKKEVIDIFMGRVKRFENGLSIQAIDQQKQSPLRQTFYETLTGKNIAQVDAYWAKLLFSGRHQPPRWDLNSNEDILEVLASDPGAISYMDSIPPDELAKVVLTLPATE